MTTRWHKSTCPFCGLGCGLEVGIENDRIVQVRGMKTHPTNRGDICRLPANYPPIFYHEDRLRFPMMVEDEWPVLQTTERSLEQLGYRVLSSERPMAALKMFQAHDGPIHLLITDVVMPEMSGKDLADEIQKIQPNTRVLYMSGYTANTIAHRGVLDTGVHFLQKPFGPDSLGRKVREVLDACRRSRLWRGCWKQVNR